MYELLPDDSLLALLDDFVVVGGDIENRVMAQIACDEEQAALPLEITELRVEVAALRDEVAELKRILLSGRDASIVLSTNDQRGKTLLPYARQDRTLPILN